MSYSATLKPAALGFREPFRLADGTELSVQTGRAAYCSPRDDAGPWTHVEVGAWADIEAFAKWLDPDVDPSLDDSPRHLRIYPYLPVEVLDAEIERRGGVA